MAYLVSTALVRYKGYERVFSIYELSRHYVYSLAKETLSLQRREIAWLVHFVCVGKAVFAAVAYIVLLARNIRALRNKAI